MVKTFARGGLLVEDFLELTKDRPIETVALPNLAVLTLRQYPGAQGNWLISRGQTIEEEMLVASGPGPDDLPLHSPIPGVVEDFRTLDSPEGGTTQAALIRLSGAFARTGKAQSPSAWESESAEAVWRRLVKAGVVAASGPLDPAFPPPRPTTGIKLVINGLRTEPYVSLNYHLLTEWVDQIEAALPILQRLYSPASIHLAVDRRDAPLVEAWTEQGRFKKVTIHQLKEKYPQAQEKILYSTLFGREPGLKDTLASLDCLILDPATLIAMYEAVVFGKPMVERFVVLSGDCFHRPGVYRVRIGTPLAQLVKDIGGFSREPAKLIHGGPFKGTEILSLADPVTKDTSSILALSARDVQPAAEHPCVRCGLCVTTCPASLQPINIYKALRRGEDGRAEGLDHCIDCGLCSFVCPSHIPLSALFKEARRPQPAKEPVHGN